MPDNSIVCEVCRVWIVGYMGIVRRFQFSKGLEHLEYRGYDSAGIACLPTSGISLWCKEKGKLEKLKERLRVAIFHHTSVLDIQVGDTWGT